MHIILLNFTPYYQSFTACKEKYKQLQCCKLICGKLLQKVYLAKWMKSLLKIYEPFKSLMRTLTRHDFGSVSFHASGDYRPKAYRPELKHCSPKLIYVPDRLSICSKLAVEFLSTIIAKQSVFQI